MDSKCDKNKSNNTAKGSENVGELNFVNHDMAVKISYEGVGYTAVACPNCLN